MFAQLAAQQQAVASYETKTTKRPLTIGAFFDSSSILSYNTLHMRLTILYRDSSEHARSVTDFIEMMRRRYPDKKPELIDIDTRVGAAEASLHGVVQYPALIVTSFEGRVLQQWEGLPLPLLDEVAAMMLESQGAAV